MKVNCRLLAAIEDHEWYLRASWSDAPMALSVSWLPRPWLSERPPFGRHDNEGVYHWHWHICILDPRTHTHSVYSILTSFVTDEKDGHYSSQLNFFFLFCLCKWLPDGGKYKPFKKIKKQNNMFYIVCLLTNKTLCV